MENVSKGRQYIRTACLMSRFPTEPFSNAKKEDRENEEDRLSECNNCTSAAPSEEEKLYKEKKGSTVSMSHQTAMPEAYPSASKPHIRPNQNPDDIPFMPKGIQKCDRCNEYSTNSSMLATTKTTNEMDQDRGSQENNARSVARLSAGIYALKPTVGKARRSLQPGKFKKTSKGAVSKKKMINSALENDIDIVSHIRREASPVLKEQQISGNSFEKKVLTKRTREGDNEVDADNLYRERAVKRTRQDVTISQLSEVFDTSASIDVPRPMRSHLVIVPKALSHALQPHTSEIGAGQSEVRNIAPCKLRGPTPILAGEQNQGHAISSTNTCDIAGCCTGNHGSHLARRSGNRFDGRNTLRGSITCAPGVTKKKRGGDARRRWMLNRLREDTVAGISDWMGRL